VNKADVLEIELQRSIDDLTTNFSRKLQEMLERGGDWSEKRTENVRNAIDRGREFISKELSKI
jgi:hypothetical protein